MWTSTTCGDFPDTALYFAFGKAYGINLSDGGAAGLGSAEEMGPPLENGDSSEQLPPPQNEDSQDQESIETVDATVDDFVDTHGPGAMRNDYKDKTGAATQAPQLAREFWEQLYGEEYPYDYDEENDATTIFDLSASENAADYIVIYNYALLVRNAD